MPSTEEHRRIVNLDDGAASANVMVTPSVAFEALLVHEITLLKSNLQTGFRKIIAEHETALLGEVQRIEEFTLQQSSSHVQIDKALSTKSPAMSVSMSKILEFQGNEPESQNRALEASVTRESKLSHTSTESGTNGAKPVSFKVLPELMKDVWVGEGLMEHTCSQGLRYSKQEEPLLMRIPKCVVDPTSVRRLLWDFLGIPVLAWDLITMPLQAFDLGEAGESFLDSCGVITLAYWSIDLPLSFITGYVAPDGSVVTDRRKILKNYLCGNFLLDLIIVLSDWADQIATIIGEEDGNSKYLSNLALMRFLRIARFIRVFRLRKLKSKMQMFQDALGNELALVVWSLFVKVCCLILINHFIGCGWYLIGSAKGLAEPPYRWVSSVPYPQYDSDGQKMVEADWFYLYVTSFHWAIAQFTPGPQNIQPQNSYERLYTIFVLLFGMVVFSYFIASVTSLRLQMSKMLSKLDRDLWILRKFCLQYGVSLELRSRMMRYIDLVVIPNYHRLNSSDVLLIPKLSDHLRAELYNELYSAPLCQHPFFGRLQEGNRAVMDDICSSCLVNLALARGDIAFSGGQVARYMFLVTVGQMSYTPVAKHLDEVFLQGGDWASEAVFWTKWTHQGLLRVSTESQTILVDAAQLRGVFEKNGFVLRIIREYATRFCEAMNEYLFAHGMPTDMQADFSRDVRISGIIKDWAVVEHGHHEK